MESIKCKTCGVNKPLNEMVKSKMIKCGYTNRCKECYNLKQNFKNSLKVKVDIPIEDKIGKIYCLKCEDNIFYVGQSIVDLKFAYYRHIGCAMENKFGGNIKKNKYIKEMIDLGKEIKLEVIEDNVKYNDLFDREYYHINRLFDAGYQLVNLQRKKYRK